MPPSSVTPVRLSIRTTSYPSPDSFDEDRNREARSHSKNDSPSQLKKKSCQSNFLKLTAYSVSSAVPSRNPAGIKSSLPLGRLGYMGTIKLLNEENAG